MFKTNTAREIFYIFLWLAGIIFLYALVDTFILEPSHDNENHSVIQEKHLITNTAHKDTKNETKIPQPIKPIAVKKVLHKAAKPMSHNTAVISSEIKTVNVVHTKNTVKAVKKEINVSVQLSAKTQTEEKTVSTPSIPKAIRIPKQTISIPSVPNVPSVPTVPQSEN